jgi:hypothetical protein
VQKQSIYQSPNHNSSVRLSLRLLTLSPHFAACVCFVLLGLCPAPLWAQPAAKPTKVFVWTFRSNSADDGPMLDNYSGPKNSDQAIS